ncbi:MAG TPA: potassium channel family protein [Propionicimonas sp.]|jgi:voltage-gated potassium channel
MSEPHRERWEARADVPLTATAVLFLAAYAIPILRTDLASPWPQVCAFVRWAAWGLFLVDYVVRLLLARDRRRFVRRNLFDLAVVALPFLRPLRLLRLVTLLTVLNRRSGGSLRGRVLTYLVGSTALILFVASLAVLESERTAAGTQITTFGGALWWAFATITTVGYGDQVPVTTEGRYIAVGLMLAGIALLGTVTASMASWLIEKVREVEETAPPASRAEVDALTQEIRALRRQLSADG